MPKRYESHEFISMPWKNGLGTTTELIKYENPQKNAFFFRLSMAKVEQDGPFSLFPGIERDLLILEGNGCRLHFPDREIELKNQLIPLHFHGEDAIHCSLIKGPIKDFNVMIDRNWGKTHVEVIHGEGLIACLEDFLFLFDTKENTLYELSRGESLEMKTPDHKMIVIRVRKTI